MQCYTPHIRYYQKVSREEREEAKAHDAKIMQYFIPRQKVFEKLQKNENYLTYLRKLNEENEKKGSVWRYQALPCRHCYACSINYAAQWATRMACEAIGKKCYFITVTYNDRFLPIPERITYDDNGNYYENDGTWDGTLVKKEAQDFIKRLRRHLEYENKLGDFKFYLAGEYGSLGRPHYHAILMGCNLDEYLFYDCHKEPKQAYETWKSHELDQLWSVKIPKDFDITELNKDELIYDKYGKPRCLKGFVQVAEANWQDMAYTARYTAKKWIKDLKDIDYYAMGKIPEFVTMSKGIGDKYFLTNLDKIYQNDEMIAKTVKNNTSSIKPPKRADILLEKINPAKYDEVKATREKITHMLETMIGSNDNYTDLERLRIQEEKITTKAKQLKRDL